ncbi:MAG: chromo domain-containing protein, partial [Aeromonas sp.]
MVWGSAHHHLQGAIKQQRRTADAHRSETPTYLVGQRVWLSTKNIRLRLPCKKLSPRYIGPFKIFKEINPVVFELQLPQHYRIHPVFHVSQLKPYNSPISPSLSKEHGDEEEPPLEETREVFTVQEILDSRCRGCHLECLVDWEGFGPEE